MAFAPTLSRGPWGPVGLVVAGLVALGTLSLGCYRPSIKDGSLVCDQTVVNEEDQCPDGFKCAVDNHCWRDPTQVKGDAGPTCAYPRVTPLCADPPATGQACNPACQTGCACGRCNVVGGVPTCVPPGSIKQGEVCKPGAEDNCAPGFFCQKESCGDNLGRCYRHCSRTDQCSASICQFAIEGTAFNVCEVSPQTCDPVADTGCPSAALHCYITSGDQTLCDCAHNVTGQGTAGAPCTFYSDCAPGFLCFRNAGESAKCYKACNVAAPACQAGETCTGGLKLGHCDS